MEISKLLNEVQRNIAMNNGEKFKGVKITEKCIKEMFKNIAILDSKDQEELKNKGYVQNICGFDFIIDNSIKGDFEILR